MQARPLVQPEQKLPPWDWPEEQEHSMQAALNWSGWLCRPQRQALAAHLGRLELAVRAAPQARVVHKECRAKQLAFLLVALVVQGVPQRRQSLHSNRQNHRNQDPHKDHGQSPIQGRHQPVETHRWRWH